jgi:predicted permease
LLRAVSLEPHSELRQLELPVDARAWAFCFGACVIAGLLSGLLPALVVSRVDLLTVLKQSGAGASTGKAAAGLRGVLVVAQVALAFGLLSGSGLALLRVNELLATPVGFDAAGVVDLRLIGTPSEEELREGVARLAEAVLARIAAQPGVESAAANEFTPLTGAYAGTALEVEGRALLPTDPRPLANRNPVTPRYFETMRIPLLRGRGFSAADDRAAAPVAVISQSLAQRFFPGVDPIGRRIRQPDIDGPLLREIVGVVGDVRRDGVRAAMEPETYVPFAQAKPGSVVFVIRTEQRERLVRELPRVVASVDPNIGAWIGSLTSRLRGTVGDSDRVSIVLGALAVLALALATLGLYGMISYATLRETRGLGIRSALGSPPGALLWVVIRGALSWLGLGSALGVLAAALIGRVLANQIPGTRSFDLRVCLVVAVTLVAAGTLAAWVPARRALRVSPAAALRYD